LNMHFRDWHRLSFTYNCTPSANYQYIPAYKHFQSTISLIHFIGSRKPWNMPRHVVPMESPYNQLLNKWWAVYDRHYHPQVVSASIARAVNKANNSKGVYSAAIPNSARTSHYAAIVRYSPEWCSSDLARTSACPSCSWSWRGPFG
jgi:lipopolysaccharide biosynthesis glycosyltransferase